MAGTGINLRRFIFLSLLVIGTLIISFWILDARKRETNDNSAAANQIKSPEKSRRQLPRARNLDRCQMDIYSAEELSKMCAISEQSPGCLVEHIDHLEQKAFLRTNLHIPDGRFRPIYVNPLTDIMSVMLIEAHGQWEPDSVGLILRALRALPLSALIDIGANVGAYSLSAALSGFKTIAVDANYQNAMRLRKSVEVNELTTQVRVYWNALSETPGPVRLRYPGCELGLAKMASDRAAFSHADMLEDAVETAAVGLDTIAVHNLHLQGVDSLVIKVDIEGAEWNVFRTASGTFDKFKVQLVLMEWEWTAKNHPEKTLFIASFMVNRGFKAYRMSRGRAVSPALRIEERLRWPNDVLWLHNSSGLLSNLS